MEAEEIIQQKEWWQLSESEMALISPIATDEAEYGLVKKMLQLSADAPNDVPLLDENVQQQLLQELVTVKPVRRSFKWYFAAAAAVIILVTGYWIWMRPPANKVPPLVPPGQISVAPEKNLPVTQPEIAKDHILPTATPNAEKLVKHPHKRKNKMTPISPKGQDDEVPIMNPYANIHTLVSADSSLMAFVTEVY